MTDPLIRDIRAYLNGDWDYYDVEAAGLLERALAALEGNPCAEVPEPPLDPQSIRVGSKVRIRGFIPLITGEILCHEPGEYGDWWVRFDYEGTSRYFWCSTSELEVV
jgi:hypothetical protein